MIDNRTDLEDACRDAGILFSIDAVWDGNVPELVRNQCETPSHEFAMFMRHPNAFPSPDELLILWSTNGDSVTAFLSGQKQYIRYWFEDEPNEFEVLGKSYQEFSCAIVGHVLGMKNPAEEEEQELANFFHIQYLDNVKRFIQTDSEWEAGIQAFIRGIETNAG